MPTWWNLRLKKPWNNNVTGASRLVKASMCQEGDKRVTILFLIPQEQNALMNLPDLALCTSSPGCSFVSFIISFMINWQTLVGCPWVPWAMLANYWSWGGDIRTLIYSWLVRCTEGSLGSGIGLWNVGGSLVGLRPSPLGGVLTVHSCCQIWTEHAVGPESWRIGWCRRKKNPTHLVSQVL